MGALAAAASPAAFASGLRDRAALAAAVAGAALAGAAVGPSPALAAVAVFGAVLGLLSVIDLRTKRLPNAVLGPAALWSAPLVALAAFAGGPGLSASRAALAAVAAFAAYLLVHLVMPAGFGMGDVKLAGYLGLHLGLFGWAHVLVALAGAFVVNGVAVLTLLALGVVRRKDRVPFGPSMALAALATLALAAPGWR